MGVLKIIGIITTPTILATTTVGGVTTALEFSILRRKNDDYSKGLSRTEGELQRLQFKKMSEIKSYADENKRLNTELDKKSSEYDSLKKKYDLAVTEVTQFDLSYDQLIVYHDQILSLINLLQCTNQNNRDGIGFKNAVKLYDDELYRYYILLYKFNDIRVVKGINDEYKVATKKILGVTNKVIIMSKSLMGLVNKKKCRSEYTRIFLYLDNVEDYCDILDRVNSDKLKI